MSQDSNNHSGSEATSVTSRDVTIRRFRNGDEQEVLSLLQRSFPRWPRVDVSVEPIEHLRWKLCPGMEGPDGAHTRVAEVGDRIVGLGIHFDQRVKLGGRVAGCRQVTDVCVLPDYRETGIYSRMRLFLRDEGRERYALGLGGGTAHPAMLQMRGRGPERAAPFGNRFHRFVRPLTWREFLETMRLRLGRSPTALARTAWLAARWLAGRLRERTSRDTHPCSINNVEAFDERVDAFWEEASRPYAFIVVRDGKYLNWRYGDRRAGNFTIKLAEQDGRLLGYAVLCAEPEGGKGYVADLLTLPGRQEVARSLLRDALEHFRRGGQPRVECWLPEHHPYRQTLEELGFLPRPQRRYVSTYSAMGAPEEELAFLRDPGASIHRTLGDTDMV